MKTHYETLGIEKDAKPEDIKKAYRKLASIHHPDKGGDTAVFQQIQTAYDTLSDEKKRFGYDNNHQDGENFGASFHNMEDVLSAMRRSWAKAQENAIPFIRLQVDIVKAFTGGSIPLNINGKNITYNLRAGMPNGVSFFDEIQLDNKKKQIQIQILVNPGKFVFRNTGSQDGVHFSGDLETLIDVDAIDLMTGAWIKTRDFLNKEIQVRLPSGFQPNHRLKVASHGYSNWINDKASERGSLFLRVNPVFKSAKDLDPEKVKMLYDEVNGVMAQKPETT